MLTLFQLYLSAMSSPQPAKNTKHKKVDRNSSCNGLGKVAVSSTPLDSKWESFWRQEHLHKSQVVAADPPCRSRLELTRSRLGRLLPPPPHTIPLVSGLYR